MTKTHIHSIYDLYLYLEVECKQCKEFQEQTVSPILDIIDFVIDRLRKEEKNVRL
jgi:hypothetical protein